MPNHKQRRADEVNAALQTGLTLIENKVRKVPIESNVVMPDDLVSIMRLVSALAEIGASLVESFDADAESVIDMLRMKAMEATS
jgi:hypothetical protein